MRILIFTDSIALPRLNPEICHYEETWPYLLKKEGHDIHQVSIGGATSNDLLEQVSYHKMFLPDIVIVQVGIVDCAPRMFSALMKNILKAIPYFGIRIFYFFHKSIFKKFRNKKYVSENMFLSNCKLINESFDCDVYFIKIIPASEEYENKLKGIEKNINKYNLILEQNFKNIINLDRIESNGIMSDFHHINKIGHDYIYSEIIKKISK